MIKGVIFDNDGVLVDTEGLSRKSWIIFFKKYNLGLRYFDIKGTIGVTTKERIKFINKKYKRNFDANKQSNEKEQIHKKISKNRIKVFSGIKKLIKDLKYNHIKIAVASSGTKSKIRFNLGGFLKKFNAIVSCEDITRGKPSPKIFLKAAKKLHLKPSECIVIEDAIKGVVAAKKAGMKCIAVTNTFSRNELKGADLIVNNLKKINYDIIKRL